MSAGDRKRHEYRLRLEQEAAEQAGEPTEDDPNAAIQRARRIENQSLWVDAQIRAAIDRGEFDDLPGAGKPIPGIDAPHDPDWWLKRLIERENITGVLPPALALRKENEALDGVLDNELTEQGVRRVLEDFNSRIVDARRQLQGGPPVITPLRDIEQEVTNWAARRAERRALRQAGRQAEPAVRPPRTPWFRRRR